MPLPFFLPVFSLMVYFIWLAHLKKYELGGSIKYNFVSPLSILIYFTLLYYIVGVPVFFLSYSDVFLDFDFKPFLPSAYFLQLFFIISFSIPFFFLNASKFGLKIKNLTIPKNTLILKFIFIVIAFLCMLFLNFGKTQINYYGIHIGGHSDSHLFSSLGFLLARSLLPLVIFFYLTNRIFGFFSLFIFLAITFPFGFRGIIFSPFLAILIIEFIKNYDIKARNFLILSALVIFSLCIYGLTRNYFSMPSLSRVATLDFHTLLFGFFNDSNIVLTESVFIHYIKLTSNFIGLNDFLVALKYFFKPEFSVNLITSLDVIKEAFLYYNFVYDAHLSGAAIPLTGSLYAIYGIIPLFFISFFIGFISFYIWINSHASPIGNFLYLCFIPWFFNLNIRGYAPQAIADFIFLLFGVFIVLFFCRKKR
jgi:hypothetical protein